MVILCPPQGRNTETSSEGIKQTIHLRTLQVQVPSPAALVHSLTGFEIKLQYEERAVHNSQTNYRRWKY
jgi:hypothetical protein